MWRRCYLRVIDLCGDAVIRELLNYWIMWRRGYPRIIDLCGDASTGTTSLRWRGAPEFDFHTGWAKDGAMRKAHEKKLEEGLKLCGNQPVS